MIRIVTPGTNIDSMTMDETKTSTSCQSSLMRDGMASLIADVSTGDYFVTETDSATKLFDEIYKFAPSEIICNEALYVSGIQLEDLKTGCRLPSLLWTHGILMRIFVRRALREHFQVSSLESLGVADYECGVIASGALLQYLIETQKTSLAHLTKLTTYSTGKYMVLDSSTRRNLELCETLREKQKRGSLLWVLDKTRTAMGARLLRKYVEQPLIDKEEITKRLDAVEELLKESISREEIREYLSSVYDLERLVGKISYQSANPRDLTAFKASLAMLPHIRCIMGDMKSPLLKNLYNEIDPLEDLCDLVERAIVEEPPFAMKEGGIIRDGYHEEVDRLRKAKTDGKTWLAELEQKEREKTGIKNLRIKYNKVFGYYLEVTNSFKNMVPDYYTRKQTLTNAERYIIPELKDLEDLILGAEDKLYALEYELYCDVRNRIADEIVGDPDDGKSSRRGGCLCFSCIGGGAEIIMSVRRLTKRVRSISWTDVTRSWR